MPIPSIKPLADKSGKSIAEVEKVWKQAKEIASEDLGKSEGSFKDKDWAYVMGITKNILKIKESSLIGDFSMKRKRFIETNLSAMDYLKKVMERKMGETLTSSAIPKSDAINKKKVEETIPSQDDDMLDTDLDMEEDSETTPEDDFEGEVISEEEEEDDDVVIEEEDESEDEEDESEEMDEEDESEEDEEESEEMDEDYDSDSMDDIPPADVLTTDEDDFMAEEEIFDDEEDFIPTQESFKGKNKKPINENVVNSILKKRNYI